MMEITEKKEWEKMCEGKDVISICCHKTLAILSKYYY